MRGSQNSIQMAVVATGVVVGEGTPAMWVLLVGTGNRSSLQMELEAGPREGGGRAGR